MLCASLQQIPLCFPNYCTYLVCGTPNYLHLLCVWHQLQGLDEREPGPADAIPPLAAAAMVQAACNTADAGQAALMLGCALLVLESAVVGRPYASAIRLALVALHTLMGSWEAAYVHLQALSIKNIQMDALAAHHMLPA